MTGKQRRPVEEERLAAVVRRKVDRASAGEDVADVEEIGCLVEKQARRDGVESDQPEGAAEGDDGEQGERDRVPLQDETSSWPMTIRSPAGWPFRATGRRAPSPGLYMPISRS
jgi:hypothetical protein